MFTSHLMFYRKLLRRKKRKHVLQEGIDKNIDDQLYRKKSEATIFNDPPVVAERYPPIRVRKIFL